VRVVVAAIVLTMASWLVSGLPRQFIDMWETASARELPGAPVIGELVPRRDSVLLIR
jgi:hypothetical protein